MGGFFVANSAFATTATLNPGTVLGTAGNFAIFSKAAITDTPQSVITGNIGAYPIDGASIGVKCAELVTGGILYDREGAYTGAGGGSVACRVTDDTLLNTARGDMETAYAAAAAEAPGASTGVDLNVGTGTLGTPDVSQHFVPGVYTWGTAVTIPNDIYLDGSATDVWVFQISGTLDISSGKQIHLTGGALAKNIFWQVTGATTLGTYSIFEGNILAATNIAIQTGATLYGRALAQTAVSLDQAIVTIPVTSGPVWEEEETPNGTLDPGESFFQTIQLAIDAGTTVSGDTIYVSAGPYNENVNVNESLTIQGAGDTTVINGSINATGDNVIIKNLKITNSNPHGPYDWGVKATAGKVLTLETVTVDVLHNGVYMKSVSATDTTTITINNSSIKAYGAIYILDPAFSEGDTNADVNITVNSTSLIGTTSYGGGSNDFSTIGADYVDNVHINFTGTSSVTNEYTNSATSKERLVWFYYAGGSSVTGTPTYTNAANSTVNDNALFMSSVGYTNTVEGKNVASYVIGSTEFEDALTSDATTIVVGGGYDAFDTTQDNTLNTGVTLIIEANTPVTIIDGTTLTNDGTIIIEAGATLNGTISGSGTKSISVIPGFSIQDAINAANSGDTINVAAGTYTETGQILINKNLSIIGDNSNKPVIRPIGNFLGDTAAGSWWLVEGGVTFSLSNVVVDGNTSLINRGLRSHGNTTITNVGFTNIKGNAYQGMAVVSFGGAVPGGAGSDSHSAGGADAHLTITNSTFADIGRIGVLVKGTGSTATLTGNTYTGKGDGTFLDYAFEFGAGGSGTVSGNTISGNRGVASDTSTSAGILVTEYYGSGTNAIITGNTFSNNSAGLHVGYLDTDTSVVTATGNNFSGEAIGVESDATTVTVNAESNWWGTASSTEIAAKVVGLVDFDPWYVNPEKTILSDAVTGGDTIASPSSDIVLGGSGIANLPSGIINLILSNSTNLDLSGGLSGNAVTFNSGTLDTAIILTNSNLAGVSASIPDGTTITGPAGWNGMITPPTSGTPSGGIAPAGFSVGSTVISIGSTDGTLVFDKPVTILLAGVTGVVGYRPSGSDTWVQITNTCTTGSYDNPTGAISPGECAINNGTDTKILTYHFTTFGSLTANPAPTPAPVSSGGYSSGGGGPGPAGMTATGWSAPTITAGVSVTPEITPAGQVLGVSTFNFSSSLNIGSRGEAVTELQNRLTAEGVYSGPITGYFGQLTFAGVKAYQGKYGISQVGNVGPLTRAQLNGSQVAGASTINIEAIQAQITSLQIQLDALIQQLKALQQ